MRDIKAIIFPLILILISLLLSLSFSACSTNAQPKLIALECNNTLSGAFKRDKKYVYVPVAEFNKFLKTCAKIKSKCNFMYNEIRDYNKKFTKK